MARRLDVGDTLFIAMLVAVAANDELAEALVDSLVNSDFDSPHRAIRGAECIIATIEMKVRVFNNRGKEEGPGQALLRDLVDTGRIISSKVEDWAANNPDVAAVFLRGLVGVAKGLRVLQQEHHLIDLIVVGPSSLDCSMTRHLCG